VDIDDKDEVKLIFASNKSNEDIDTATTVD
jgi:hypothetical protein